MRREGRETDCARARPGISYVSASKASSAYTTAEVPWGLGGALAQNLNAEQAAALSEDRARDALGLSPRWRLDRGS